MSDKDVKNKHYETIISEKEVFSGRVFRVAQRDVELENGEKAVRDVVYHNGGAAVLPVDIDGTPRTAGAVDAGCFQYVEEAVEGEN